MNTSDLRAIFRDSPLYGSDQRFRRRVDLRLAREQKFVSMRLFNLDIEVTNLCNLACRTCYNPPTQKQTMSVKQFGHILVQAHELINHLHWDGLWLTISGGEPLMNEHLWEMLRLARASSGVKGIAIITNGTLIDKEKAELIESLGIEEVMVSLDGAGKNTHDSIRGRGSFVRTMAGVEALVRHAPGTFLGSTLTLTSLNLGEIKAYVELVFDLGGNYAWINPPLYCGRIVSSQLSIPYEEHLRVMKLARQLDTRYFRQAFSVYYNIPYYPLTDPISPYLDLSTSCPWGRNNLTVTSDGSVLPCLYSRDLRLGNVLEQSLFALYESPMLKGFRDGSLLAEPCRSCSYWEFCGGCRARTYYLTGNWMAADPWCPLVQGSSEPELRVFPSAVMSGT